MSSTPGDTAVCVLLLLLTPAGAAVSSKVCWARLFMPWRPVWSVPCSGTMPRHCCITLR